MRDRTQLTQRNMTRFVTKGVAKLKKSLSLQPRSKTVDTESKKLSGHIPLSSR
jgi:hypothetical protein